MSPSVRAGVPSPGCSSYVSSHLQHHGQPDLPGLAIVLIDKSRALKPIPDTIGSYFYCTE